MYRQQRRALSQCRAYDAGHAGRPRHLQGPRAVASVDTVRLLQFIVACLTHDIGYVRGLFKGDGDDGYVVDAAGRKVSLPRGSSDAALAPYMSSARSCSCWTGWRNRRTRRAADRPCDRIHEVPLLPETEDSIDEEGSLLRAADLIGQLGDPQYLRKANALYHEFEEIGLNKQFGYESPADLVDKYPQFYWNSVSPHIQAAIRYLNMTSSGRRGSRASIAMSFAPNASCACRDRSRKQGRTQCPDKGTPLGIAQGA